jgi:hypothetical protein
MIFRVIGLLLMLAGAVATQSRTVILTIPAVVVVYYWLRLVMQKSNISVIASLLGVSALIGALAILVFNAGVITEEVTSIFGEDGEGTVRDRVLSYSTALAMLGGSPLFGLSAEEIARHSMFVTKLHNMWLGMALFSGLFGVILVVSMIVVSLVGALRLVRHDAWREYGFAFTSFIMAPLWFSPNFYPAHNAFIFWFFIGVALTSWQTLYFERRVLTVRESALKRSPNTGTISPHTRPIGALAQADPRRAYQPSNRRGTLKT